MSNEQMVSVPASKLKKIHRDLDACQKVIWLRGGFDPAYCKDAQDSLKDIDALLAQPAAQHQGEPVAWLLCDGDENVIDCTLRSDVAKGWPEYVIPLHTHADAGEVERLRAEVDKFRGYCVDLDSEKRELEHKMDAYKGSAEEVATLRAQLAERDALLIGFCSRLRLITGDLLRLTREDDLATSGPIRDRAYEAMDHARKVSKILSASAEPSAPKCETCHGHGIVGNILNAETCTDCTPSAPVERDELEAEAQRIYESWSDQPGYAPWVANGNSMKQEEARRQARAALERKSSDDIPDFSPGSGNRAERRATELVAQLQADLTARDERIDQLESQLMPDLHSTPEERGTPETEPCSGCGTPGWTGACDKCIPY